MPEGHLRQLPSELPPKGEWLAFGQPLKILSTCEWPLFPGHAQLNLNSLSGQVTPGH